MCTKLKVQKGKAQPLIIVLKEANGNTRFQFAEKTYLLYRSSDLFFYIIRIFSSIVIPYLLGTYQQMLLALE